jgi:replicative DNA helicase
LIKQKAAIIEIEANYLGCMLKDNSLVDESVISENVLTVGRHKEWFKIIMKFNQKKEVLDFITLRTLDPEYLESIGGRQYMAEMVNSVASTHSFKSYENHILNAYNVRQAKDIAIDFLHNTQEFGTHEELMHFMESVTRLEVSTNRKKESFKSRLVNRMTEHMDAPLDGFSGVHTGFSVLNKLTDGWQKKDLIVLGGRPSMGKTAFGLATLVQGMLADSEVYPTFMSAEMSEGGIIDRLIAQIGGVNLSILRNINKYLVKEQDQKAYTYATGKLGESPFEIFEESTVPAIRARMRQRIKEHPDKKHVCCIDFLTQLRPVNPTGNANYDYGEMVLDIKQMAKDLEIPVILLVQLNRQNEQRQDKRPGMSDIRDTGTVEQAADFIGFIHRQDYYERDAEQTNVAELIIAKNRQGQTGTVYFNTDLQTQRFTDRL